MKLKAALVEVEFPRPLAIEKIPATGLTETLEAKASERQSLADRFGLIELSKLQAEVTVKPLLDQTIAITGRLVADVVQTCVVSLESLPAHVVSDIDVLCAVPELASAHLQSLQPGDKEMEEIIDGTIDLGELVAQNLGIALNPYPRKPGLEFVDATYAEDRNVASPFSVLKNFPKKPKN